MSQAPQSTERLNALTEAILGAAFRVHTELGPGLLESVYEHCLAYELDRAGIRYERQKVVPVVYRGVMLDVGFRADILAEDAVIVEVKAIDALAAIHDAQLLTYLKLAKLKVGLLLNFNVRRLKFGGIRRLVLRLPER